MGRNEFAAIDQYKSGWGLVSILMGIASIIGYMLLFLLAYMSEGEAGLWIGVLGFILLFVVIAAIVFAVKGLKNPDAQNIRPVIALIENGMILFGVVTLYIIGATK